VRSGGGSEFYDWVPTNFVTSFVTEPWLASRGNSSLSVSTNGRDDCPASPLRSYTREYFWPLLSLGVVIAFRIRNEEVAGSSPATSTNIFKALRWLRSPLHRFWERRAVPEFSSRFRNHDTDKLSTLTLRATCLVSRAGPIERP